MNGKPEKEHKDCDRLKPRCRNRLRDCQLRPFYRGRMELGWIFSILTAAQLALAMMNDIISKKKLTVITL